MKIYEQKIIGQESGLQLESDFFAILKKTPRTVRIKHQIGRKVWLNRYSLTEWAARMRQWKRAGKLSIAKNQ